MKFSELSREAKLKAAQDYLDGWLDEKPDDELTISESLELCMDTEDECDYDENGVLLDGDTY